MTAVIRNKRNQKQYSIFYRTFCFLFFAFAAPYRLLKKTIRKKTGKKVQFIFSILAFACLSGLLVLPSMLEQDAWSFETMLLTAAGLLTGFGIFCDLAGAFRPYHYQKKKAVRQNRRGVIAIDSTTIAVKKSA